MLANETFWVAMALVVFLGILFKAGVHTMILSALDGRGQQVQAELDEAKRLRVEAEHLLTEYKARQQSANAEAERIIKDAEAQAKQLLVDAESKLKDYVARRKTQAETKIAQAENQAIAEVRGLAADKATAVASRILEANAKNAGLVESSIAQIKTHLH